MNDVRQFMRARAAALAAGTGAVVLALGGIAIALAPAALADGTVITGNQTCSQQIPNSTELKVEPVASGTYTDGTLTVVVTVRTLAADDPAHPGDQTGSQVFDFTATGGVVLGVVVKGGPNANFYDYRPAGVIAGTGLHAPVIGSQNNDKFYGLSHISFCYGPAPSPSPSPTPTPSETPSPKLRGR